MHFLVAEHGLSKARACRAVRLSRASIYRAPPGRAATDQPVSDALNALVAKHPRWGFGLCFDHLRLDGQSWNHKRVRRVYRAMGLNLPRGVGRSVCRPVSLSPSTPRPS